MASKKQFLEAIQKADSDRRVYFEDIFRNITEDVIREMCFQEVGKDGYIIRAGTPCDCVYLILHGQVIGMEHLQMGRVYAFLDFSRMYILGDYEQFGRFAEFCVSIRAVEPCSLIRIPAPVFWNWIQSDAHALTLRLYSIMNALTKERKMDREYIVLGCKERLATYLVKLYERHGCDGLPCVRVEKTQQELADRVGFNVRSVQRSIAILEKEGYISLSGGKITISQEQYKRLTQAYQQ